MLRRQQQYSVLQTLGLTDGGIFRLLLCELCVVFCCGYSLGCLLGNGVASLIYAHSGRIFVAHDGRLHSGVDMAENVETLAATNLPDAGAFHVDWSLIGGGAVFLLLLLVLTSALLVRQMRRFSLRQLQAGEGGVPRSRRIISLHRASLTGVLTKRFMLARKRTFASIILSLALGSVIFLGATYVIREHAHQQRAGLCSGRRTRLGHSACQRKRAARADDPGADCRFAAAAGGRRRCAASQLYARRDRAGGWQLSLAELLC